MAALSAVVFTLSWWLGLYLLARDPRKPVLVLAAIGLTSFALAVALDDVHFADPSSWEALRYFARHLDDARLLVIARTSSSREA